VRPDVGVSLEEFLVHSFPTLLLFTTSIALTRRRRRQTPRARLKLLARAIAPNRRSVFHSGIRQFILVFLVRVLLVLLVLRTMFTRMSPPQQRRSIQREHDLRVLIKYLLPPSALIARIRALVPAVLASFVPALDERFEIVSSRSFAQLSRHRIPERGLARR